MIIMVRNIGGSLMVKNLNKICVMKLLVFATIALSCVSMWGCGDDVRFLESGSNKGI